MRRGEQDLVSTDRRATAPADVVTLAISIVDSDAERWYAELAERQQHADGRQR